MKFEAPSLALETCLPGKIAGEVLLVGLFEGQTLDARFSSLPSFDAATSFIGRRFKGEKGEQKLFLSSRGPSLHLLGLGKKKDFTLRILGDVLGPALRHLRGERF